MKISIIIPTFNKLPRLKLTITSLLCQKISKEKYEVIFINDGSTDDTDAYFMSSNFQFNYQYYKVNNVGRAAARNIGIRHSKFDLLLFIDDDLILSPNFIQEHLNIQEKNTKIVHGRIYNLSSLRFFKDPSTGEFYDEIKHIRNYHNLLKMCINQEDIYSSFDAKISSKGKVSTFEDVIENIYKMNSKFRWLMFNGGNTSIPKSWVEELSGFDEQFGILWGCEDLELGYRLYQQGKEFAYSYLAANFHMTHYRKNYKLEHHKTLEHFYSKHQDISIIAFEKFVEGKWNKQEFLNYCRNYID